MSQRIPTVIVSGYLGARKTTFLPKTIPQLFDTPCPLSIIFNSFANAEVDSALLREVAPAVQAISNRCK